MVKGCISHDKTEDETAFTSNSLLASLFFLIHTLSLSLSLSHTHTRTHSCPSLLFFVCLSLFIQTQTLDPSSLLPQSCYPCVHSPPGQYLHWASAKPNSIIVGPVVPQSTRNPIKPTLIILISGPGSFNMARASLIMLHTAAI